MVTFRDHDANVGSSFLQISLHDTQLVEGITGADQQVNGALLSGQSRIVFQSAVGIAKDGCQEQGCKNVRPTMEQLPGNTGFQ